jgi:hypothetical protein
MKTFTSNQYFGQVYILQGGHGGKYNTAQRVENLKYHFQHPSWDFFVPSG